MKRGFIIIMASVLAFNAPASAGEAQRLQQSLNAAVNDGTEISGESYAFTKKCVYRLHIKELIADNERNNINQALKTGRISKIPDIETKRHWQIGERRGFNRDCRDYFRQKQYLVDRYGMFVARLQVIQERIKFAK